jgi:hypothetical protein
MEIQERIRTRHEGTHRPDLRIDSPLPQRSKCESHGSYCFSISGYQLDSVAPRIVRVKPPGIRE